MKYIVISDAYVMICRRDNNWTDGDSGSPKLKKTENSFICGEKPLKNCIQVWHIYHLHISLSISPQKERMHEIHYVKSQNWVRDCKDICDTWQQPAAYVIMWCKTAQELQLSAVICSW